jgi:HSP20 family protein
MNWKKIAPWNWFKDEEGPAVRGRGRRPGQSDLDRLSDELFQRLFEGSLLADNAPRIPALLRPNLDISESRKAYTVRAELPGVDPDDIAIEVEGQTLVLRGEKQREQVEEDEGYHCTERSYGSIQRVLSLPEDADCDAIDARFKHGVLSLRIPKRAPKVSQGRRIEIQAS